MDRAISLEARRVDLAIELPFLLGGARIDPPAHEITIRNKSERMQPQTLKVLVALHDKVGHVVTRDELVDRCWDGRIVGEDVINRCILLLRRFADESRGFRIETVPRAGYRLIETHSPPAVSSRHRWIAAVTAITVVLGGVAGWSWLRHAPGSQGAPPTPSITVIPFSAAANDQLARQIAQEAPASLERMMGESGFAIVHAEPRGTSMPRADYVFTGSVRRVGSSIAATVQFISERDQTITFTHDFSAPVERASDLPDQIGATEAAVLAWTGAEMVLDPRQHLNPAVTSELLKSMSAQIELGDSLQAYQLSRHAASFAPNSAVAQLSLAMEAGFSINAIPRDERGDTLAIARRASDRALAMAPEFGDVYIPWCLLHSPRRMIECEGRLRRGLTVDYRSSFVPGYLSALDYNAGRTEEAVQLAEQSLDNDPYKPAKLARMIRMLEAAGDDSDAERIFREANRLWPDNDRFRFSRLLGIAESGNYARLATFVERMSDAPMPVGLLEAWRMHDLAKARRACASDEVAKFKLSLCMTVLADVGDRDRAFAIAAILYPSWHAPQGQDQDRFWLDHPDGFNSIVLNSPAGRAMRTDPRFLDLARSLGLVDYWRSGRPPDFCTKTHEPVCVRILGHA